MGELELEENILAVGDGPGKALEQDELRRCVRAAVEALNEPGAGDLLRHYYYGQRVADIAAALGLNEATVKTKLRRGRAVLAETLRKGGYEDGV